MTEPLYKLTAEDGSAIHGGKGRWHLPVDGQPGAWMPVIAKPVPCVRGYHLCRVQDLSRWLKVNAVVWSAEGGSTLVTDDETKAVTGKARLVSRVGVLHGRLLRAFATDCAARSLPHFEKRYPAGVGPREAIDAARAYARGEITLAELRAKRAYAIATYAIAYAAYAAAYAADAAAAAAERLWQGEHLLRYLVTPEADWPSLEVPL
jgi:hypothetical protein